MILKKKRVIFRGLIFFSILALTFGGCRYFLTKLSLRFLVRNKTSGFNRQIIPEGNLVKIPLKGYKLAGIFFPPKHSVRTKAPAVIICYGNNQTMNNTFQIAGWLQESGLAVFTFDYRGFGLSEGRVQSFSDFKADLSAALNYLSRNPKIQADRIGILGLSLGTVPAVHNAAADPRIKALVLHGPIFSGDKLIEDIFNDKLLTFCARYLVDLKEFANHEAITKIKCPLLLIQEEQDRITTYRNGLALFEKAPNPKELWVIPSLGHLQSSNMISEEYRRRLVRFFGKHLNVVDNG